jgi:hypothetical protein
MQYSCRPGKKSAFLEGSQHPSETSLPRVAAIIDDRNGRVYALQNQNCKITSWIIDAEGPDDTNTTAVTLSLEIPAMSLDVFYGRRSIMFGTLLDGSAFIAIHLPSLESDGGKAISKHVLEQQHFTGTGCQHVCTTLKEVETTTTNAKKRKAIDAEEFILTQVFVQDRSFLLVQRHIYISSDSTQVKTIRTSFSQVEVISKHHTNVSIDLFHLFHAEGEGCIGIVYREVFKPNSINGVKKRDERRKYWFCSLSLNEGLIKDGPFQVSSSMRHIGFLGLNLVVAAAIDSVLLYDTDRGVLINSIDVSEIVADTKDWRLKTDHRRNRIVLVSAHSNCVHVAAANCGVSERHQIQLADGLRSSMVSNAHLSLQMEEPPSQDLLYSLQEDAYRKNSDLPSRSPNADIISDALSSLRECINQVLDPKHAAMDENFLLKVYEGALSMVLVQDLRKSMPQTEEKTVSQKACVEIKPSQERAHTPAETPQSFVDGAVSLILATLQLPRTESRTVALKIKHARLNARLILSRLIRCGKVSVRQHFNFSCESEYDGDSLFAILRAMKLTNKRGQRVVSPVDLIHEMLSSCSDISERQLVTMIHYMLCKALPDDIAENFLSWKRFDAGHPYKKLSREFFLTKSSFRKLELQNGKKDDQKAASVERHLNDLSAKLLNAGVAFLVERIVWYSSPNDALLRTALTQGLTNKREAPILAEVLVGILEESNSRSNRRRNWLVVSKWLAVLCEACHDVLTAECLRGKSHMDVLLHRIHHSITAISSIASLAPVLESMKATVDDSEHYKKRKGDRSNHDDVRPTKLAAYSIEEVIL